MAVCYFILLLFRSKQSRQTHFKEYGHCYWYSFEHPQHLRWQCGVSAKLTVNLCTPLKGTLGIVSVFEAFVSLFNLSGFDFSSTSFLLILPFGDLILTARYII